MTPHTVPLSTIPAIFDRFPMPAFSGGWDIALRDIVRGQWDPTGRLDEQNTLSCAHALCERMKRDWAGDRAGEPEYLLNCAKVYLWAGQDVTAAGYWHSRARVIMNGDFPGLEAYPAVRLY